MKRKREDARRGRQGAGRLGCEKGEERGGKLRFGKGVRRERGGEVWYQYGRYAVQ